MQRSEDDRNWIFPSTLWVLGIKLRSWLSLGCNACTHPAISPAPRRYFLSCCYGSWKASCSFLLTFGEAKRLDTSKGKLGAACSDGYWAVWGPGFHPQHQSLLFFWHRASPYSFSVNVALKWQPNIDRPVLPFFLILSSLSLSLRSDCWPETRLASWLSFPGAGIIGVSQHALFKLIYLFMHSLISSFISLFCFLLFLWCWGLNLGFMYVRQAANYWAILISWMINLFPPMKNSFFHFSLSVSMQTWCQALHGLL